MLVPRSCNNRIKKSVDDIDASRRVTQRGITVKIALNMWDGHMPQQNSPCCAVTQALAFKLYVRQSTRAEGAGLAVVGG